MAQPSTIHYQQKCSGKITTYVIWKIQIFSVKKCLCIFSCFHPFFFLSEFSFTNTDNSEDSTSTFHSSTFTHSRTLRHLQFCTWDDYHIFLIAQLAFTRLLLNEIYHLIELQFDWLMMWCWFSFGCLLIWFWVLLQLFDMRNWWTWTRINYHSCITSESTKVC